MVDAHDVGHPPETVRHTVQVMKRARTGPHSDYPARVRYDARMIGGNQPAALAGVRCQRRMGQHQWSGRHRCRPLHEIIGTVRNVDNDPERIAPTHDVCAKIREPAMNGRLCLDVTELIDTIVRQLQMT